MSVLSLPKDILELICRKHLRKCEVVILTSVSKSLRLTLMSLSYNPLQTFYDSDESLYEAAGLNGSLPLFKWLSTNQKLCFSQISIHLMIMRAIENNRVDFLIEVDVMTPSIVGVLTPRELKLINKKVGECFTVESLENYLELVKIADNIREFRQILSGAIKADRCDNVICIVSKYGVSLDDRLITKMGKKGAIKTLRHFIKDPSIEKSSFIELCQIGFHGNPTSIICDFLRECGLTNLQIFGTMTIEHDGIFLLRHFPKRWEIRETGATHILLLNSRLTDEDFEKCLKMGVIANDQMYSHHKVEIFNHFFGTSSVPIGQTS